MDAPRRSRWIGLLLATSLVLGACGSGSTDDTTAEAETPAAETTPDALALDGETGADDAMADDAAAPDDAVVEDAADELVEPTADELLSEIENMSSVEDLSGMEITPELFEFLRTDENARSVLIEQMAAQGLSGEPAECFIDNVSAELFATFGAGEMPTDAQMGELLELLSTCEVTLTAPTP